MSKVKAITRFTDSSTQTCRSIPNAMTEKSNLFSLKLLLKLKRLIEIEKKFPKILIII